MNDERHCRRLDLDSLLDGPNAEAGLLASIQSVEEHKLTRNSTTDTFMAALGPRSPGIAGERHSNLCTCGCFQKSGALLGVPVIRIIVYCGLFAGPIFMKIPRCGLHALASTFPEFWKSPSCSYKHFSRVLGPGDWKKPSSYNSRTCGRASK